MKQKNRLLEFTQMHDEFIQNWKVAMKTGDTSAVERMAEDYYVAFFSGAHDKPMFFNKIEAVTGMKQSVMHFLGAEKRFENRVIRLKSDELVVVFYEQVIVKEEQVEARLFTIESWKKIDNKWMIVREIEEPL
ncbi:hypothetical protein ACFSCX_24350 [Bacillus salitolerans]|uniref:DUF4440 domain-containing protein n=1 Tax=Bacillus salitolerans TaxID=1437434 RepID=A0ABW4LXN4_9BACI